MHTKKLPYEPLYSQMSLLGEGGFGQVWLATDTILGRQVAIKVLHKAEGDVLERFREEMKVLASLCHKNIVQLLTASLGETPYIVTEYVDGETLEELLIRDSPLPLPTVIRWFSQLVNTMIYAHDKGILHRDLKPANIIINQEGVLKVTDFGLANRHDRTEQLTAEGVIMGTPGYMAPELIKGLKAMESSYIFAAGVVFYEMLTLENPFRSSSLEETIRKLLHKAALSPKTKRPDLPTPLASLAKMMLSKEQTDRPASFRTVQGILEMAKEGKRLQSEKTRIAT